VLLNSTKSRKAEKEAAPNLTLRGFQVIDAAKAAVEKVCPGVVSCADILALVARDAVHMLGGPFWNVPTGRRDGLVSIQNEAVTKLPPPNGTFSKLKSIFASNGLDVKDLVVLSGGHTIGISHCNSFSSRLYNFTGKGDMDPSLDKSYAAHLKMKCKPGNNKTIVEMDPGSFRTFDTHYYVNVKKNRGLFQSDAALLTNNEAQSYINKELESSSFLRDFARSMEKMSRIGVLTGTAGQIRRHCAFTN
jgi:peroxidase